MKHTSHLPVVSRAVVSLLIIAGVSAFITGCKTSAGDRVEVRPGEPIQFNPTSAVARLRLGEGRYPSLYASSSVCVWQGAEVLKPPAGAEPAGEEAGSYVPAADPNFFVFECHLASGFSDSSIAYDVVGFRGMHVYLETPQGAKIPPAQKVIGSELEESQAGALKIFARKNTLIFPATPLVFETPEPGAAPPTLRLVLEGYDSVYYFEWFSWLPDYAKEPVVSIKDTKRSVKEGYKDSKRRFLDFSHKFD